MFIFIQLLLYEKITMFVSFFPSILTIGMVSIDDVFSYAQLLLQIKLLKKENKFMYKGDTLNRLGLIRCIL